MLIYIRAIVSQNRHLPNLPIEVALTMESEDDYSTCSFTSDRVIEKPDTEWKQHERYPFG